MPEIYLDNIKRSEFEALHGLNGLVLAGIERPSMAEEGTNPAIIILDHVSQVLTIEEQQAFVAAVIQVRFKGDNTSVLDSVVEMVAGRIIDELIENTRFKFLRDENKPFSSIGKPCGTLKEGEGHA